jgi:hypothetical protein
LRWRLLMRRSSCSLSEIVTRLHTSISHVTWVIMAYNLALIVTTAAVIPFARRLDSVRALIAALGLSGWRRSVADSPTA